MYLYVVLVTHEFWIKCIHDGLKIKTPKIYHLIDFLNKMNFSKKCHFLSEKSNFLAKMAIWQPAPGSTASMELFRPRRTKFQTQFSTLTHPFLTFSCQKKSWKGFLSLVTQEKTLVTLWKTLVTQGKTLVTKGNTLVTGGKTLVTKVKTLLTNALRATRVQ